MKGSAQCSPTAGECCNGDSCQFESPGVPCGQDDECAEPRVCDGKSNECPEKVNVKDGQLCSDNSKSCLNGHCLGSACASLGYESCSCSKDTIPNEHELNCIVCCKSSESGKCQPINELDSRQWPTLLYVGEGDICTNDEGYCDVFHRCRSFVEEGLLLKVITRLFSSERWSDFASQYWWAIILIVISVIVIMAVFVHFTAIYTPTQNPNVKTYQGPKAYMQKRYTTMKTKREERSQRQASGLDQPDGAPKTKATWEERRKKTAKKMTQTRRVVVAPPKALVTTEA